LQEAISALGIGYPAAKRVGITKALAFLPQDVRNALERRRRGRKDRPGTYAARKQQIDAGRVRTGFDPG
jgi:hypothetical protein